MTDPRPTQNAASPLSEERVREYEQMLAAVTPGPWTFEVDVRPWQESAHYVIRTVEHQPSTPWSPRFIAWMNGGREITPQRFAELSPAERARLMDEGVRDDQRIEPDARFIAASPTIIAELLADRTALTARLEAVERDAARLDWIRDNAERGLTEKADDGTPMLWTFWTPLRKGADWLRDGIDAALSRS